MEYTIYNATIITVDEKDNFYSNGAMVVKDGIITDIGKKENIKFKGKKIDMHGKIVMPGLINAHTHTHSPLFKNILDDMKLMDWLKKGLWPLEKKIMADDARVATACSCLEFIKNGITTYADQVFYANDVAEIANKSGLRCFLAATVLTDGCAETMDTVNIAEEFIKDWKQKQTLVYPCIGPHAPYSVSEEDWKKVIKIAEKYNVLIHTHISETQDENNEIMLKHNFTPTQWLDKIGIFRQKTLAAHSIHLTDKDIEIYKNNNVCAVYNPVSNLKLVSGIMPIEKMYKKGITVAIGTDGAQSNNSMDLLQDVKIGALLQKQKQDDATFLNSRTAIRMLTIDGAKALGIDKIIGSLEKGKSADFITFNNNSINFIPLDVKNLKNIYTTIIYTAIGTDVADTVVAGKWLMKDRKVMTLEEIEILRTIQDLSLKIRGNKSRNR